MVKLSIRSLLAHKLRMAMSVFAVVLGTAFISGALVFGDSLNKILDGAFTGGAVDLLVTPKSAVDPNAAFGTDLTLKDADVATVKAVPGVASAQGDVNAVGVFVLDANGKVAGGTSGAPGTGIAWLGTGGTSAVTQGAAPASDTQIALDEKTAETAGVKVGGQATVLFPNGERQPFTVSGLYVPPGSDLGQQTQVAFAPATAQKLAPKLLLDRGTWSSISVALAGGQSPDSVKSAVTGALGSGYTVDTRAEQIKKAKDASGGFVSVFTYILLGFAIVALLVGGFLIFNTFSMVVAQRAREMALLRAIGARKKQVSRALLLEAFLVGLVGSVVGLLLGLLVAVGLGKLLGGLGLDLTIRPSLPASAVIYCLVLGVLITVVAAWIPTRRAGKIPPIAALRDSVSVKEGRGRVRFVVGLVLLAVAAGLYTIGIGSDSAGTKVLLAGAGAGVAVVIATIVLAPAIATVLIRLVPRTGGAPALLARRNTVRNPRRTAATAAAITIGVALVTGVTVFATSLNASLGKSVDTGNFRGEYAVSSNFTKVPAETVQKIAGVQGVGEVATQDSYQVLVDGKAQRVGGQGGAFTTVYPLTATQGTVSTAKAGTVTVDTDTAKSNGWKLGQKLQLTFPTGVKQSFTIAGLYTKSIFVSGLQGDLDQLQKLSQAKGVGAVFVTKAAGASTDTLRKNIEAVTANNPLLTVQNIDDLKQQVGGQINQLLYVIYGLLILSIIIAVLGVINTMAMSVLERTREIGLLRAIGFTRRYARRMIRRESVLIALLGAVLGVASGLLVGIALQRATKDSVGLTTLGIPWLQIVLFFVLAALVGVLAALAPARRAARMDVLGAIATD